VRGRRDVQVGRPGRAVAVAGTVPRILVSWVPPDAETDSVEVASSGDSESCEPTVIPTSRFLYGPSPICTETHCPATSEAALAETPSWSSAAAALPWKYTVWSGASRRVNFSSPNEVVWLNTWLPSSCPETPVTVSVAPLPDEVDVYLNPADFSAAGQRLRVESGRLRRGRPLGRVRRGRRHGRGDNAGRTTPAHEDGDGNADGGRDDGGTEHQR